MSRPRTPPPLYTKDMLPLLPPRQSKHARLEEAGEAADIALGAAEIAVKAGNKAVAAVPIPDPRSDPNFQRLAGLEQSMLARITPWGRNRWPDVVRFDERIGEFDLQQEDVRANLTDLHNRQGRADADYAVALAEWMAAGQVESKPVSKVPELEAAIIEAEGELAALDNLRERVIEEKLAYVRKHRGRLARDAERATGEARERVLRAVDEYEKAREELVGLRQTAVWANCFPSETLASHPPHAALLGGRNREAEQHLPGLKRELPVYALLALLRADANYFSTVSTIEQAAVMQGTSVEALKGGAMWAGSEEDQAWTASPRFAL